jgi:hypothetical protein
MGRSDSIPAVTISAECITHSEVGYTIIDDVLSLPERMPAIYRRLTT